MVRRGGVYFQRFYAFFFKLFFRFEGSSDNASTKIHTAIRRVYGLGVWDLKFRDPIKLLSETPSSTMYGYFVPFAPLVPPSWRFEVIIIRCI